MNETNTVYISEQEIQKKIKENGWKSITTRYAPAFGVGIAAMTAILDFSWYCYIAAGILILIGPSNAFLKIYVLGKGMAQTLREEALKKFEEMSRIAILELEDKLKNLKHDRAAKQLEQLEQTFQAYKKQVANKLAGKRGLEQCLTAAEDMRSSALHNLNLIVDYILQIKMLDVEDSKNRIKELESKKRGNSDEANSHRRQIEMATHMENGITQLVERIEGSITAIKEAVIGLNDIQLGKDSELDIEQSVGKFREVADMNKRIYSKVTETMRSMKAKYE